MERSETSDNIGGPVEALLHDGYLVLPSRQDAAPIVAMLGAEEPPTLLEPKAVVTQGAWSARQWKVRRAPNYSIRRRSWCSVFADARCAFEIERGGLGTFRHCHQRKTVSID